MWRSSSSTWFSWTVTSSAVRPWTSRSHGPGRTTAARDGPCAAYPRSCRRCQRRSAADPWDTHSGSGRSGRRAAASSPSLIERYGSRVNERLPRISAQKKYAPLVVAILYRFLPSMVSFRCESAGGGFRAGVDAVDHAADGSVGHPDHRRAGRGALVVCPGVSLAVRHRLVVGGAVWPAGDRAVARLDL